MPLTIVIAIAFLLACIVALSGARAEAAPPAIPPAGTECRKVDRCVPTREELSGKPTQDQKLKTRHDTVKNSINNVR